MGGVSFSVAGGGEDPFLSSSSRGGGGAPWRGISFDGGWGGS